MTPSWTWPYAKRDSPTVLVTISVRPVQTSSTAQALLVRSLSVSLLDSLP